MHPDDALARELADLRWLGRLALRLVTDPSVADDACQEAWLQASKGGTIAVDRRGLVQALRSFLWRTRRADHRRSRREQEASETPSLPTPAEILEANEQRQRVWTHLMRLQEPFQSALVLRYQEDIPASDIARQLGLPGDTIRWRLRRGLQLLRESLERDESGGGLRAVALGIPVSIRNSTLPAGAAPSAPFLAIGTLAMVKTIAALVLGVVSFLLFTRLPAGDDPVQATGEAIAAPSGEALASPEAISVAVDQTAVANPVGDSDARRDRGGSGPSAGVASPALLVGRIVDETGAPRSGIDLTYQVRGRELSASSDSEGAFRFELPPIDAPKSVLVVRGSEMQRQYWRDFSIDEDAEFAQPETAPGSVTDLGDIVLQDAFVITGRVVGPEGQPVEGARVLASGNWEIRSDVNGSFRGGYVNPWEDEVRVTSSDHLDVRVPVTPSPGGVVDLGEIRLSDAPLVRGRVVDSNGFPIPTAWVRRDMWDSAHEVQVAQDGSFEIHLDTLERPGLTAKAVGYLEPYFAIPVRPGQEGVVIELKDAGELCKLRVVDAASGAPVEFVNIEVDRGGTRNRGFDPLPRLEFDGAHEYPTEDGWIAFRANPGLSVVDIAAYGYASAAAVVEENPGEQGQVLHLKRPRGLAGQVFADGEPVEGAEVVLAGASLGVLEPERVGVDLVGSLSEDPLYSALESQPGYSILDLRFAEPRATGIAPAIGLFDGFKWTAALRRELTGSDGRFVFTDLQPGGHQVFVRGPDGELAYKSEVFFADGDGADIGRLELQAVGSIQGRIRTRDGVNLAGHRILMHQPSDGEILTDENGAFQVDCLPPGQHFLYVDETDDIVNDSWGTTFYVEVQPGGETPADLVLDARGAAQIEVTVTLDGIPMAEGYVALFEEDRRYAGAVLDESGRGTLAGAANSPLRMELHLNDGSKLQLGDLQSFPLGRTRLDFELQSAPVELELPSDLQLYRDSHILLEWSDSDGLAQAPMVATLSEQDGPRARVEIVLDGARLTAVVHTRGPRLDGAREVERWAVDAEVAAGEELELSVE